MCSDGNGPKEAGILDPGKCQRSLANTWNYLYNSSNDKNLFTLDIYSMTTVTILKSFNMILNGHNKSAIR